jgi:2,3-bisphosphoglycerate-independent phosphoglycerate mutase
MDYFAGRGVVGLARTIPPRDYLPGTDIGSMSVFGYDPRKYFTGRGPLEAAVHGIRLGSGDVAFRCNLVTIERDRLKDFSADHISLKEAATLIRALTGSRGKNSAVSSSSTRERAPAIAIC